MLDLPVADLVDPPALDGGATADAMIAARGLGRTFKGGIEAVRGLGLDPVQTGRELLELQCGLYGITGRRGRERAQELLELVGLTEAAERRTKTYSGA
jgi:ABC-type multidrug transport system ATPase subunit